MKANEIGDQRGAPVSPPNFSPLWHAQKATQQTKTGKASAVLGAKNPNISLADGIDWPIAHAQLW